MWAIHSFGPPEIWALGTFSRVEGYFAHVMSAVNFWNLSMVSN
jgi:hypothetical protein